MKRNNKIKVLFIFLLVFLLSGCTKILKDDNKKVVTYDADIVCNSCSESCKLLEDEFNSLKNNERLSKEDEEKLNDLEESLNRCKDDCNKKCDSAKKNQTGQSLTQNILCKPTNSDVIEIYEKYGVNISELDNCSDFNLFSNYEGLWASLFVKPLAWIIIKFGLILNNYGLSLIIISILIRVLLMPITRKTAMQSENIKKAQPEIDRINKKYENKLDNESQLKKNQEILFVYKKYDINPLSSCLFAFIQIPLLFAFLEAINRTPAIFEEKLLGFHMGVTPLLAITSGDFKYLFIVVILGLVTYYSLNLSRADMAGSIASKQSRFMTIFMLIFIVFASFNVSTAICFYWISTSLFTILQNLLVKKEK